MWIAKKQMQVKRDGGYVAVKPGEPVPEASTWPSTRTWVDGGFIKWVDREEKPIVKSVVKPPAKATTTKQSTANIMAEAIAESVVTKIKKSKKSKKKNSETVEE